MPIRYEDRYASEIRALAKKRGIPIQGKTKAQLIAQLRGQKVHSKHMRRSPNRLRSYEACVKKVKQKGSAYNPYAVCNVSVYGRKQN